MTQVGRHLSQLVKREALWRCEECDEPDGAYGYYYPDRHGNWRPVAWDDCDVVSTCLEDMGMPGLVQIALVIHHVDGNLDNNDRENLVALCRRCRRHRRAVDRERRRDVPA